MDSREITLTPSAFKYGNLNIRPCGKGFFPPDVYGESSKKKGMGVQIILHPEGLKEPIRTDIPKDSNNGKTKWMFRKRGWVKKFLKLHKLKENDSVKIERINQRKYNITPNNGSHKIENFTPTQKVHDKYKERKKRKRKLLNISHNRICECSKNHINCLSAKEWLKSQIGVWQFYYEKRDIRDKKAHPATFPISLAKKVIELFSHKGELILDPFVGSGTTLISAQDTNRNAVGFDLKENYIDLSQKRLEENSQLFTETKQLIIKDDAINIPDYLPDESVKCIFTSPPYSNLLNRKRKNKSRRSRKNHQYDQIEQYSQNKRDLGTMGLQKYTKAMGDIFQNLLPLLKPKAHCVINVPDMWWQNTRITIHVSLIEELRSRGYELRNIIIWDRTNIVNRIGIFGWPSNYITMGVTFEYILHFIRKEV